MDAKQIAEKLIHAARFSVNPAFSLFSYRNAEWTLIASNNVAIDIASEYVRFAISGQWGDCLELRADGVRVPLCEQLADKVSGIQVYKMVSGYAYRSNRPNFSEQTTEMMTDSQVSGASFQGIVVAQNPFGGDCEYCQFRLIGVSTQHVLNCQ